MPQHEPRPQQRSDPSLHGLRRDPQCVGEELLQRAASRRTPQAPQLVLPRLWQKPHDQHTPQIIARQRGRSPKLGFSDDSCIFEPRSARAEASRRELPTAGAAERSDANNKIFLHQS